MMTALFVFDVFFCVSFLVMLWVLKALEADNKHLSTMLDEALKLCERYQRELNGAMAMLTDRRMVTVTDTLLLAPRARRKLVKS